MRLTNFPAERKNVTYPWVTQASAFSPEEVDKICELMSNQELVDGVVGPGVIDPEIRKSKIKFFSLNQNPETAWIFDRLNIVIHHLNENHYMFDLNGYEAFQYTEYTSEDSGKYNFHMDMMMGRENHCDVNLEGTRKLSLSLLLNDPGVDFEGGEFKFNLSSEDSEICADMKKGDIIVFPSFMIHRVSEITKGLRKSIVVWVLGPKFK